MAQGFAKELVNVLEGNFQGKSEGSVQNAGQRTFRATLDLSNAAVKRVVADTNVLARIPPGCVIQKIEVVSSVSLTTSQLSFGIAGAATKYGAAKAYGTTVDALVTWQVATAMDNDPLTTPEDILMTIGTADLPASGIVVVIISVSARG
jgi:hypothetical protein